MSFAVDDSQLKKISTVNAIGTQNTKEGLECLVCYYSSWASPKEGCSMTNASQRNPAGFKSQEEGDKDKDQSNRKKSQYTKHSGTERIKYLQKRFERKNTYHGGYGKC